MERYLNIVQIMVSIVLVLVILLQVREMGTGLFGSSQATFRTRRGVEKTLFQFTIVLVVIFLIVSVLSTQPKWFTG